MDLPAICLTLLTEYQKMCRIYTVQWQRSTLDNFHAAGEDETEKSLTSWFAARVLAVCDVNRLRKVVFPMGKPWEKEDKASARVRMV
jgi:hypothetical protein